VVQIHFPPPNLIEQAPAQLKVAGACFMASGAITIGTQDTAVLFPYLNPNTQPYTFRRPFVQALFVKNLQSDIPILKL
jgi:hypothetical protein